MVNRILLRAFFVGLFVCNTSNTLANEQSDWSGQLGVELRRFLDDPTFVDQLVDDQISLTGELEYEWESVDRNRQVSVVPFFRAEEKDDERNHVDLREAYWRFIGSDMEVLLGLNRVFWGVTESRHLVNIINQVDAVENIDEEDFLGQPMINIRMQKGIGRFDFYALPYFRERTFTGIKGRLRGPLVVNTDSAIYESSDEEQHIDTAFRYSHYFGNWDVGLSWFHGTAREPILKANSSGDALLPFYSIITQTGLELQYTGDRWLWKVEAISRTGHGKRFSAYVVGFEFTFYQFNDSNKDLGVLVEYLKDNRDSSAPVTVLQDDVFAGVRLGFNDSQDTALLAGILRDTVDDTTSFRIEAERRLGQSWKLELEGQAFTNVASSNAAAAFANDDFIQLTLTKYW